MKTTTAAATPTSASFAPRTGAAASVPARAGSVIDYRTNIERQTREQKSVGDIISIMVYVLIGFVVIGASLAGYGAYVLSKQIHQQSVTMTDLDNRYAAQNREITNSVKTLDDALTETTIKTEAQIGRQQELILRQQDSINKLTSDNEKLVSAVEANESALHTERQTRSYETTALRNRLHLIENQSRFNP